MLVVMKTCISYIIILISLFVKFLFTQDIIENPKRSMVWMCLERCGDSTSEISKQVDLIKKYAGKTLTAVSFELYNLGEHSQLVENDLAKVYEDLHGLKGAYGNDIDLIPMISSYPYPEEFIDWMRELFQNPTPFINKCVENAKKFNFNGYNIDFEPVKGIKEGDDKDYADFLTYFSNELHKHGLKVSVDISRWSTLWNFPLLNKTASDQLINMQTYTPTWETWVKSADYAIENIENKRLGVGICTNCSRELEKDEVIKRFDYMIKHDIKEVDIWRMRTVDLDVDSVYWNQLERFHKKSK